MTALSLRDLFAAHVAATLATRVDSADTLAAKAYDLADALLRERARREPDEERAAIVEAPPLSLGVDELDDPPAWLDIALAQRGAAFLDEPPPPSERDDEPDPRWLERESSTWEEGA